MKLMINIPDEAYELLKSKSELDNIAESIIANGTPISTEGDLISRSDLKEKIDFVFPYDPLADYEENIGEVMKLIDNAPTVDKGYAFGYADGHGEGYELGKSERPQGEWIDQNFDDLKISDYRCNQCGHYQDDITNFCPNCGADMRKGGAE